MKKYYDVEEIWRKLMEELSELDIDDSMYYSFKEDNWCFGEYFTGIDLSDVERIQMIFQFQDYDEIDPRDIDSIERLSACIKRENLYRDMMVARCNYAEYMFKTFDKDDDEITKLSHKYQISVEIYLWFKYIFAEVVKTFREILNNCNSIINEIYEFI